MDLTIITRRFWPYAGTTEQGVAWLVERLLDEGHRVEVVTIAWQRDWPSRFQYQGAWVTRLPRPVAGPWGWHRYLKGLSRLLKTQPPAGLIVVGLGQELQLVARQQEPAIPFLVYLDEAQLAASPDDEPLGVKDQQALAAAESVVLMSEVSRWQLRDQADLPADRLALAPLPLGDAPDVVDTLQRHIAREVLSEAHPMLRIQPDQPLVVCGSPLVADPGWQDLLQAWQQVTETSPQARLWIPGHQRDTRQVWDAVVDRGLMHQVILPGQFDCPDEVLAAADLVVHPLHHPRYCPRLVRAARLGICPLITTAAREWLPLEDQASGIVLPPGQPQALATMLLALLADPDSRGQLGLAAAGVAATIDAPAVDRYFVQPFRQAAERPAAPDQPSAGSP